MWALGCILGELVIGKPIFPGNSTLNQIKRILEYLNMPKDEEIDSIKSPFAKEILKNINLIKNNDLQLLF